MLVSLHHKSKYINGGGRRPCGVVAKVLDYDMVVSEIKLHSRYYVHFRIVTHRKCMKLLIPWLNSIPIVPLLG